MLTNQIYLGDCLDLMRSIPDHSIDLILCDLPYGTTQCSWDVVIPFEPLWEQYKRITKDTSAIVLTGCQPFTTLLIASNLPMFKYCWYWIKERPTNIMQIKRRPGKVVEEVVVFYKNQCTYNPQKTIHHGKLRTNVLKNGNLGKLVDSSGKKPVTYRDDRTRYPLQPLYFQRDMLVSNLHPTQKPIALFEYLIKTYTNEGDIVLDNCVGSGTTGVACKNLNRDYLLIEKDPIYYQLAKDRIESVTPIHQLF